MGRAVKATSRDSRLAVAAAVGEKGGAVFAAHILLPEDKTPKTLLVNGEETAFALTTVGESRYVDAVVTPTGGVADFEVLY